MYLSRARVKHKHQCFFGLDEIIFSSFLFAVFSRILPRLLLITEKLDIRFSLLRPHSRDIISKSYYRPRKSSRRKLIASGRANIIIIVDDVYERTHLIQPMIMRCTFISPQRQHISIDRVLVEESNAHIQSHRFSVQTNIDLRGNISDALLCRCSRQD